MMNFKTALIVGAGDGLSASLARLFTTHGLKVALAARNRDKLQSLCHEIGAAAFQCDATQLDQVQQLFQAVDDQMGSPDVVVLQSQLSHPRLNR